MGWKSLQATRYGKIPASGELSFPAVSLHTLVLIIRPAERLQVRYEGVKRDKPLPAGSITVVPGGTSPLVRWRGSMDTLVIHLEPSLVTRVATESFEFDSSGTVVPPLAGLNLPELRSVTLAVDAELSAGNGAGVLPMVESLATILSVHLLRHTTSAQQRPASVNGMLPRRKLRTVIEFIMENLRFTPTLEQMADLAQLSPSHFLRQFKAATGLTPHQYVITRALNKRSTSCGPTTSWTWRRLRSALASRTKAIFPFTSKGSSAPHPDSIGFQQEFPKRT